MDDEYSRILSSKVVKIIEMEREKLKCQLNQGNTIQSKHYTIIMQGGKVLSCETNCNLGKPTNFITRRVNTNSNYYTRHSEIQALQRMRKTIIKKRKMNSLLVINFKLSNDLSIKNACCCTSCLETLCRLGINKVVYSLDNGSFVKMNVEQIKKIAKPSKGSLYKKLYT